MKGMLGGGVLIVEMQKLFEDHFYCFVVDEFYTSQICCNCKAHLERCMNKDRNKMSGFQKEIPGVRYCRNCPMKCHSSQGMAMLPETFLPRDNTF